MEWPEEAKTRIMVTACMLCSGCFLACFAAFVCMSDCVCVCINIVFCMYLLQPRTISTSSSSSSSSSSFSKVCLNVHVSDHGCKCSLGYCVLYELVAASDSSFFFFFCFFSKGLLCTKKNFKGLLRMHTQHTHVCVFVAQVQSRRCGCV